MSNQPPSDPYWGQGHGQGQGGQVPQNWQPTPGQQGGQPPHGQPTPPPGQPPYGQQQPPQPGQQWGQHGYEPPPTNWGAQYGQAGQYGYQPQQQYGYSKQSQATTALVLSILGFFCCGLLAIPGTIMGRNEVKAVDAGLVDPSSRGTAQAAFIIGAIVLALNLAVIAFYIVAIAVAAAGA